jgi:uncharacterized protein involved in type VI secretion and phage assembly
VAHAIPAIVVANEDPDGLGKVQVRFDFEDKFCEYWMPLATLTAGSPVGNRGFIFIPELNDMVLVSFFDGNPEFPFILSSMFHGKNGKEQGGLKHNNIKTIITRSGHTFEFDDDNASLGITIKDKNNNVIHLDTKDKSIEITAIENITLTSKNVSIIASETVNIESKDKYNLVAKTGNEQIHENLTTNVSGKLKEVSKNHEIENEELLIKSSSKVEIKSPDTDFGI